MSPSTEPTIKVETLVNELHNVNSFCIIKAILGSLNK